jgi:hypothetical protein
MKWLYYIPHLWLKDEKAQWEDVYLLPAPGQPRFQTRRHKRSLWVTIDALGTPKRSKQDKALRQEAIDRLGDKDHCYEDDPTNMLVRQNLMDKDDFLGWVKVWIMEQLGDPDPELLRGTGEDFAGTNQHACEVAKVKKAKKQYDKTKGKP